MEQVVTDWVKRRAADGSPGVLRRCAKIHALSAAALVVIPLLLAVYDFGRHGRSVRLVDEYFYYAHARSWYFDGDCDYDNDILMAPGFRLAPMYARHRTATGHLFNHFTTGTAIVSFPLIALGDVLTVAYNALSEEHLARDGYSYFYQMTVGFGHTLLAIAGLLAAYVLAARYFPPWLAGLATLAVLLGTNALYYVAVESTHSHADSIAWVAILLLLTDNVRRGGFDPVRGLLLGLVAGLMIATRSQDVAWGLVPVMVLTPAWLRGLARRDTLLRTAAFAALAVLGVFVAYIPQLWVNQVLHGQWLFNAYREVQVQGHPAVLHWTDPNFLRPLFDPVVGLVWTAPLVLLAIPGLLCMAAFRPRGICRGPGFSRPSSMLPAIALGALLMYYVVACVWWTFSGFGHRYLSSCTAAYALGLCVLLLWASKRRWRSICVSLLIVGCVSYQCALLAAFDRRILQNGSTAPLYTWLIGS